MKTLLTLFFALLLAISVQASDPATKKNPPPFAVLGATEAQLVARYGKGREMPPNEPATRALCFDLPEFTVRADFFKGTCGLFMLIKNKGEPNADDVVQALERAGGKWHPHPKANKTWEREDGGIALVAGVFRAETGEYYKARTALVPIKGL